MLSAVVIKFREREWGLISSFGEKKKICKIVNNFKFEKEKS